MAQSLASARRGGTWFVLVATAATLWACDSDAGQSETDCPKDASFGALWSGETTASRVTLYRDQDKLLSRDAKVKGMPGARGMEPAGQVLTGMAKGENYEQISVVEFDPASCRFAARAVTADGLYQFAVGNERVYSVETVNGVGGLRVHEPDGTSRELTFPGLSTDGVGAGAGYVVVLLRDEVNQPDSVVARIFDGQTLAQLWEVTLPTTATGRDIAITDDMIYVPETHTADSTESNRLLTINLHTHDVGEIALPQVSPFRLRVKDGKLYTAHSFMNPSFHPMASYRTISVLDLANGQTESFTATHGIEQIEVTAEQIYAYGVDDSGEVQLSQYDNATGYRHLATTSIERPSDLGYVYPAGFFLLER